MWQGDLNDRRVVISGGKCREGGGLCQRAVCCHRSVHVRMKLEFSVIGRFCFDHDEIAQAIERIGPTIKTGYMWITPQESWQEDSIKNVTRDPFYQQVSTSVVFCGMQLLIHALILVKPLLTLGHGWVITSHCSTWMWWLIYVISGCWFR